ncbi:MAG: molybdopterin-dependent oxidoreductase [Acidimicrobiales bacterium]|nr:molybdopterin-dependent oxidoreductase [Acidimicrobiales bacterium]
MNVITENTYRQRWSWDKVAFSSHCGNCIANCSYRIYVHDGVSTCEEPTGNIPGYEGVPDMNPLGCQKGAAWQRQLIEGDRIFSPLRRIGPRGDGKWEEISWDEAFDEVGSSIVDAIETSGSESVIIESGAESGVVASTARARLSSALGAICLDPNASVSDIHAGHWLTFGNLLGGSSADDTFLAELIIIWNGNPAFTRIPYYHYLTEARYRGATVVVIAPDYSPATMHADYFVPVRPGSDAALLLSICHVMITENLIDINFIKSQTDLTLLVNKESKEYLRESDVIADGRTDRFFELINGEISKADPERLRDTNEPSDVELDGKLVVKLLDGSQVEVETVYSILKRSLTKLEPEKASKLCGVSPETIRDLARLVSSSKTKVSNGLGSCKHYHGDLMERSLDLMLGLSGNWGKPGCGLDTYIIAMLEGEVLALFKRGGGALAGEEAIATMEAFMESMQSSDEAITPGKAFIELMRISASMSSGVPPAFFYYHHGGFKESWDNAFFEGDATSLGQYIQMSEDNKWWEGLVKPSGDTQPKFLLQAGTNILRRTRGGQREMLANLWPKLDKVVTVDFRMNLTGLFSDIFLPIAAEGERVELHAANSHSFERMFSDKVFEPPVNVKSEWEVFDGIAKAVSRVALSRGLASFNSRDGQVTYTSISTGVARSESEDDSRILDEILRDSALSGNLPPGFNLDVMREKGWVKPIKLPLPMSSIAGGEISDEEPFVAYRNHVEEGVPFETLTKRAQYYIDQPWFIKAGEALPTFKETPPMGGDLPLVITGGHPRWSIHATNTTNTYLLETTRGHPVAHINPEDADKRGFLDDELVELFNDLGSLKVNVKITPAVRPGQVILYASWEPHLFANWKDATWVEPGFVKWLHFVAGYGHLNYTSMQWQATQSDRVYRVDLRKIT